jgi:hypothetical protein
MDIAKKLQMDPVLSVQGKWVPFMEDVELLIASSGSPGYRAARRRLFQKAKAKLRAGGEAAAEAIEDISLQLLATEVLKGWRNITEGGKPIEYTPETAYRLLKEYPTLAAFVDGAGDDVTVFQIDEDDRLD